MKKILTILLIFIAYNAIGQSKQPDTSRRAVIYWSEIIRLQQLNNELAKRIHKLDIKALSRDTIDSYNAEIGYLLPLVYKRTYPEAEGREKK